jgi:PAS domain S-box-containing protein
MDMGEQTAELTEDRETERLAGDAAPAADVSSPPIACDDASLSVFQSGRDLEATHSINQRIFDTTLDLILVVDRRGNFLRVSPSSAAILGYRPEELVGRSAAELLYPDDLERTRSEMRLARRGQLTRNFETRYVHKEGRIVTLAWTGVWSEADQQHFFIGRDMTEHNRAAERLRELNETLHAVIEASPVAIVGTDPSRTVLIWNRAAETTFGYRSDEAIGRAYDGLVVPQERHAEFQEFFDRACSGYRMRDIHTRRSRKDGTLIDVLFASAPVYAQDGTLSAIVFALQDVTRRNALEEQLRQSQKMEAIGQLTGGLAHDLNNLLAIIIGNLDLLQERIGSNPGAAEVLDEALQAALQGADLNQRLLAFARRQPLQSRRVELNDIIVGMAKLLRRTLGEHIEIAISTADDLWPVVVDPTQLEAALTNLAVNGRDAMPKGGQLAIASRNVCLDQDYAEAHGDVVAGDYVALEISDTGVGMRPEVLARVFEPFFTTKEKDKGTGLGLSMVFGFVKQSGGHVNIYSEVGLGTTVRLYLPRANGAPAEVAPAEPTSLPRGNETVLVVEDNEKIRRMLLKQLDELGYRTLQAANGQAAIDILKAEPGIDLLFTDIVMPGGLNGWELARLAGELRSDLKILFTSGFPETAFMPDGSVPERVHLLGKPYRRSELAQKLRDALAG